MSEEGKEITDLSTLAKVKTVEEMMPRIAEENQIAKWNNAYIEEDHYRIIEECLKLDCTVEEACMAAWISTSAYYKHRSLYPDFARRMELAKQFPKVMARAAVQKRIRMWDSKTALRYLELRDKKRYNTDMNVNEDWEDVVESKGPIVQFISVASNEWADQRSSDTQNDTKPNSASDTSASSSERETPRENEEQALRNLSSLSFNSD